MPMNADKIAENANIASNALKQIKEDANLTAAFNLINGTFFSPVEDLFSNFLETGKFAFKEFAQSILKAISQIVAKVIATGIITLLASLFIPGFGAAGGGAGSIGTGQMGGTLFGQGGGGGGGGTSAGGAAGAGSLYGGGGGGGGASLNGFNSGAGGTAGAGVAIVTTYF
jgi:hypothetical protein